MIYHGFQKWSVELYTVILYDELLHRVSELLDNMLWKLLSERDYNAVFGKITEVLVDAYSVAIPARSTIQVYFTLFMQEEFNSMPKEQWKLNDPEWFTEREQVAKAKLLSWIREQIKQWMK